MPEIHAARRRALRQRIQDAELDALLVTDLRNIRYLTGFTGSNAALLVHEGGDEDTVFCTDGRYTTQAEAQVPDLRRIIERPSALALVAEADDRLGKGRAVGFESQHVSVEQHATFTDAAESVLLVRGPGLVERLREVKDDTEIAALRAACAVADRALADLLEHGGLRPGRTEREVARELENRMADHGADAVAFPSIVAAGANSAIPHHRPTGAVLAAGDFVKLDFGAVVDGYHSDMTRTIVLGEPAQWQRDLYTLVAAAQAAGTEAVRPGHEVSAVDAAARTVIDDAGFGEQFTHSLGHGVGLDVHEAPSLAKTGAGTLSACMAVTVEPGVYLAGRGGVRIEDTLVVREGTPELLTMSTKELVVA
ncbi:Xaa-Pro peptidase family protein [Saccharomonospora xinjiangensis]|uniref:Xaa-Pro aminopeptidase n=1 Tax=Saccharomonospora xinjiangensis XJ-54 TaxID=882086 RepID=I0UXI3_9PSEU|nr:Xaa-Pro peptidase family protein [Saccharomonospora xinjiangensis]EID52586.1 Xaa-Pro aminopeptidase [Saccharomonospora xinjiangensis XJ-54]QBQ60117.1 putative peptidase [Saccharomonospora xinjiangensis]